MKTKKLITLFFCLFIFGIMSAQEYPYSRPDLDWEEPNGYEWAMKTCDFDTSAGAVILLDQARIYFEGEYAVIRRHRRIKILDRTAFNEANIFIPYQHYNRRQAVTNLKAHTLKRKPNGKVERIKLDKDDKFVEERDEYYSAVRFTFPAVEVGAILEYRYYFKTKNHYFLKPWFFQNELPTLYSKVRLEAPRSRAYNVIKIGHQLSEKYKGNKEAEWELDRLPGYKDEEFVFKPEDYAEQIHFQLAAVNTGSAWEKQILDTWAGLSADVMKDYEDYLDEGERVSDLVAETVKGAETDKDRLKQIFYHVRDNYSWDDYYGCYPDQKLKEVLETKKGNLATKNLLLMTMLQEAGFEIAPVLISTRQNGKIIKAFPLLSQFNAVIASVKMNGNVYLLDASSQDDDLPWDLLPLRDLNYVGLMLKNEGEPQFININPSYSSRVNVSVELNLENRSGQIQQIYEGYNADKVRSIIADKKTGKDDGKAWELVGESVTLESTNCEGWDDPEAPVQCEYKLKFGEENDEEMLYISILELCSYADNPFKHIESRNFPVELPFPASENILFKLIVPEGYEIVELPKEGAISLENNSARFFYRVTQVENTISIASVMRITDTIYYPEMYSALREFFGLIADKMGQVIVLHKKT